MRKKVQCNECLEAWLNKNININDKSHIAPAAK